MTLYEAIFRRKSIRKFKREEIDEQLLAGIEQYGQTALGLWPDIRVKWKIYRGNDKRIRGLFQAKPPYYIALYSEVRGDYQVNAGCLMEQLSLYLTTQGIGSCYQGGISLKRDEEGMEPVMVMAFGYPDESLERKRQDFKRLELGKLVRVHGNFGRVQKKLLEPARLAPSAFNRQPWRFVVRENRIHLFTRKPGRAGNRKNLNMNLFGTGIALAHMLVTAEELWFDLEYEKLDSIMEKDFQNYLYVGSLRLLNEFRTV